MNIPSGISVLTKNLLTIRISSSHYVTQIRLKGFLTKPKLKNPFWFFGKNRMTNYDFVTIENKKYIQDVIEADIGLIAGPKEISALDNISKSLTKISGVAKDIWSPEIKRTGVIAKKIGQYPLWLKNGKKTQTTLLQVIDNHVVKYIPPDNCNSVRNELKISEVMSENPNKFGCILVGTESVNPSMLTKEYCGLFKDSGVVPKRYLTRFFVSPQSALTSATPLNVTHFQVGDYVDVRGKTIDYGFQGVIKRWGFKGMSASHGVTKTHKRPGNIGGGGEKGRVWPGTKMPGHMGNKWRILRGLKILRINTKYNVMWVHGGCIAGPTNSFVYIYDTVLPLKRSKLSPPFPNCYENDKTDPLLEELFCEQVHNFKNPSIGQIENKV